MGKFDKFEGCGKVLSCPVCGKPLQLQERTLVCEKRHSFDLAKQGYVNLLLGGKPINEYTKVSFQERQQILEKGMYAHLLQEIREFLEATLQKGERKVLVDAGCGEGYYARELAAAFSEELDVYGVDLSRDSIQIGAKSEPAHRVKWFVSDISKLPVGDGAVDFLLDIFTSANYQEFQRVLAEDGYLIKIIPGEGHVKELREAAKDQLYHKEYKERRGAEIFEEKFDVVLRKTVSATHPVTPEERDIFINMTPLLFQVDKTAIDWSGVTTITVEGEVLIGKKK